MAPPTESADILAAEQKKKEEKNKAREERKKADAEKKKKEAEEEAMKLRNAQLELANSIRHKGRPGNNRQLISKAKMVSSKKSDFRPGLQSHQAQTSTSKPDKIPLHGMRLPAVPILKMGIIEKMAPESNVDQPAAAVASVSTSTIPENIFFVGQIPIRIPSSSEETKTNGQEMNNNVELGLEKDNKDTNNAEAETVPGTTSVTATLPAEEIGDLNAVSETNQVANAIDMKEIPLVSEVQTTMNHEKSNDDNNVEARGNEAIGEEEQNESNGKTIVLGTTTTVTTSVPVQEGNNINDVLETNQVAELLNMKESLVVSEAMTSMDQANDSKDDEFQVVRRKKPRKEKPNESNAEATKETENQTQIKKAEATRKKGYKEQDNEAAKGVEEAAIVKKRTHKKKRKTVATATANTTEVDETASAPATEDKNHDCVYEEERDQKAKRVEEAAAAAAKKKREKRERKKKRKAEKLGKSCLSVRLLPYLALVGLLVYGFQQVS